jgi:hypothetical protein
MNKFRCVYIFILACAMLTGLAASSEVVIENPVPVGVPDQVSAPNFTKLEITPRDGNLRMQPGESKEIIVTIKNMEDEAVTVKPHMILDPYGQNNVVDLSIKPESAKISAGDSQKFTFEVNVPSYTTPGYYSVQIAFTDETWPTPPIPYPNPPTYVHVFTLNIYIWMEPKIQIAPQYISDSLQAGKEYDYEIKLKNIGKEPINIDPKLSNDFYYGQMPAAFTSDAITISSPSKVPAGAIEIVKVHVDVPKDSRGSFAGSINLNIDDPSFRDYGGGNVPLNFNVWRQPTEAFVKSFSMKEAAPLTIEVSSGYSNPYPFGMVTNKKQPSFQTKLVGPDGNVDLKVTKTVIKGGISMGGEIPPWELDSKGIYQESSVQLIETYETNGSKGEWKLKVLPNNTERFDYSITIGE